MANTELVKTNFSAGEIAPELMGRSDLRLYQNGAKTLENVFVQPTGGVTRRHGLRYVDALPNETGRLVPFEKAGEPYLLVLTHNKITVFKNDVSIAVITSPWSSALLPQVSWVQSNDELLMVHPQITPRKITFNEGTWALSEWVYNTASSGRILQPYYQYAKDVSISASHVSGTITLTTNKAYFNASHVGLHILLNNKAVRIQTIANSLQVVAVVLETLPNLGPYNNWKEAAFSSTKGWPKTVAFHQDRLVIGGSRDLPNRLFMSKTGDMWNFDLGEGLDDEAIEFSILSDQQNDIQGMFSSRHLLIFTSGGEWLASGSPLTPGTIQLQRQGRVGSRSDYFVPLQDVDGATYFISKDGRQLREMFYSDVEGAYNSTDLAVPAKHMVVNAIDQSYDPKNRLLHVVLADGSMSILTIYRTEGINAWSRQITDGAFRAVRTVGNNVYVIVQRAEGFYVERFDQTLFLDSARAYTSSTPLSTWSGAKGFSHIPSRSVSVILDDVIRDDVTVSSGTLNTDIPGVKLQAGLPFTSKIEPLPPSQLIFAGMQALRLVELKMRLFETSALTLDTGFGPRRIPLVGTSLPLPKTYLPRLSKDVSVRAYGWTNDLLNPLWSIEQSVPQPFTLLSVTASMKVSS